MANLKISGTLRSNMVDEITAFAGASAVIDIYSGTQPTTGGDTPTGTLLGSLVCGATFAPAASGGVLTLNSITGDSAANATGQASWFRLRTSGGTWVMDGDISVTGLGGNMTMDNLSIQINESIDISSFTITAPSAA